MRQSSRTSRNGVSASSSVSNRKFRRSNWTSPTRATANEYAGHAFRLSFLSYDPFRTRQMQDLTTLSMILLPHRHCPRTPTTFWLRWPQPLFPRDLEITLSSEYVWIHSVHFYGEAGRPCRANKWTQCTRKRGLSPRNGDFLLSCFAIESREKLERGIRVRDLHPRDAAVLKD